MTITERIFLLMSKNGLSQKDFSRKIGANEKTVSAWKKNSSLPSADLLSNISECFDVSLDYLITGREASAPALTNDERELLDYFRQLSPIQQGRLLERAAIMSEQNDTEALKQEKVS